MRIAFVDVDYKGTAARAACVLAESWEAEFSLSTYIQDIDSVELYEPGHFYRRELPCLLPVLQTLPSLPETVVVDGMCGCLQSTVRISEPVFTTPWAGARPSSASLRRRSRALNRPRLWQGSFEALLSNRSLSRPLASSRRFSILRMDWKRQMPTQGQKSEAVAVLSFSRHSRNGNLFLMFVVNFQYIVVL
jgi:hypothetical protein